MKHRSGVEWFREIIKGDGSDGKSVFLKGTLTAFGNKFPLSLRKHKLVTTLEKLVSKKEQQRHFYTENK